MNSPSIDHKRIPAFPKITAQIADDATGEVSINGISHPITGEGINDVRTRIVATISATADKIGRPVKATTTDPDGVWPLIIHPDGTVEQDSSVPPVKARTGPKAPSRTPTSDAPSHPAPAPTAPTPPVQAPSPAPVGPPPTAQARSETAQLRALWQSAQWWEEAINEHNQARGYLHRGTLMNPPQFPPGTGAEPSSAPRDTSPHEQAPASAPGANGAR
ncbi:hypothetical protein KIK06_17535 [Nocardiopsis sp. EMB25]|uniref:hypothetical protein n=1 Tax=Nocardiopsis sp. EMB25 TaxID=2835867 RepID=UPI00228517BC|nr:hypothetical protein [Nocardiopsis sp. EMB25]MCY9785691.1 hypothetical protein [Nocardiopsis sp. EMB25]